METIAFFTNNVDISELWSGGVTDTGSLYQLSPQCWKTTEGLPTMQELHMTDSIWEPTQENDFQEEAEIYILDHEEVCSVPYPKETNVQ